MKHWITFTLLALLTSTVFAQQQLCPTLVEQALAAVDERCAHLGRNEVCYGSYQVAAYNAQAEVLMDFASAGDVLALEQVRRLVTFSLDVVENRWGIALLSVQANLPDTLPGQNVTLVVFGLAELTSADPTMQTFRFVTGIGRSQCAEVPVDGILLQTPAGVGTVNFTINGVDLTLGSTVLLRAPAQDQLELSTLEGRAQVTSAGVTELVLPGFSILVEAGQPPSAPQPSTSESLAALPLAVLPEAITLPTQEDATPQAETPALTVVPNVSAAVFERVVGIVVCSYRGGVAVPAGEPFALRIGWRDPTLEALNEYVRGGEQSVTYDGEALALTAVNGPRSVIAEGEDVVTFQYDWFFNVAAALPGAREVVWSDNRGSSISCTVTGE
ncbi:MAG: hypothetical protein HXY40_11155 [Chloroflexi bacterium]|nr:hypothetical protein [Chloroflexota bacterium]